LTSSEERKKESVSRRNYIKYLGAGAVVVAATAAGGYYGGYDVGFKEGYKAGYSEAPVPVRIGTLVGDLHHADLYTAISKGFYTEENIEAIRMEYASGPLQMMGFAAGDIDAGYVGVAPLLTSKSKGVDLKAVASANLEGSALVSAIIAKPEIKEVKDLDKRQVGTPGIGTIQDSLLYIVEKKFGITLTRSHMNVANLPLALEKGEIDAYIAWEPFPSEAVVKGIGQVIYTSHDIFPNHQCCVLYVSGKMFSETPDIVKKLIRSHIRAAKVAIEQPDDAMNIFADKTGKSLDVVKEAWKRMIWDYHVNEESVKVLVNYLIEQGKVNAADVPDVEKFVSETIDSKLLTEVEATV